MKVNNLFKLNIISFCLISGCSSNNSTIPKQFGDFSYNGIFLTEYATKQINLNEAKQLLKKDYTYYKKSQIINADNNEITTFLSKYSSLVATTFYYVSDSNETQIRKDIYQGTDFKILLESNCYEPFGQMNVKYIYINDNHLDYMEQKNCEFINDEDSIISPFISPYTYHTNSNNQLIIQTHSFAELPATINGGVGSTFREDSELLLDYEGKITYWQSSLGIYTSTPTGTIKQGYIFSVSFEWLIK